MISFIINNQASKCPKEIFYETFHSARASRVFNDEIIVVDDSGVGFDEDYYYNELFEYDNVILRVNKKNEGLLASRYVGLSKATGNYVRFIDSGDTCINPYKFRDFSIILFDAPNTLIEFEQNNSYYHTTGTTSRLAKLRLAALTGLMCSTVWTKLYHRVTLLKVFNEIIDIKLAPNIFHLEDYLILCSYLSLDEVNYKYISTPFIHYDLTGESNQLNITAEKLDKVFNDAKFVRDKLNQIYGDSWNNLDSLIDHKILPYCDRFQLGFQPLQGR